MARTEVSGGRDNAAATKAATKTKTINHARANFADKNAHGEVYKPSTNMSLRSIIRERRQWALRNARRREGPNEDNQLALGQEKNVLKLLLNLCRVQEWDVVR